MKFSIFQISRKGSREKNEDRMGYCYTQASGIFFLADGMGGHPQGEVAAQLALQTIAALYQKEAQPRINDIAAFLASAVLTAHRQILHHAIQSGMLDTPRTTLVMALVQDGAVSWIHCGDSRLYLVRQGSLLARTRDHSFLEQHRAAAEGKPSTERINRNVLFTCLGSPTKPVFDIAGPVALQQGDKLMLCSDGLWDRLSDADVVDHLAHKPVSEAVPDMVESALRTAGDKSDNVTCIAIEWEMPDGFESTRGSISTDTLSEGFFASTFQADTLDAALEDLDDAAIERSIAEINDAIRRSALKKSS
ncbi:MAG: serine/threonine-protein phosphatase [Gammaproteobacteria bacterium]|uniref:PP2C family protein-serine/threonine phosphatase n=1 Tax=Rhodoferax sp. TaxID=50421 RepID=UPI0017987FF4|nr:PP2C family serine/threonine-protein phosphatase [Rhodoferax sp.]MBU3898897.1 serine/threonine-protein phosphatase [Gammaproteobacteria bacterium]MBA3059518.1 serine/threonine-protein phosphatase [Rhodoferax sp.]MBU3999088.1 serine/threonine-protein phosphatase [Gammaproteobacteria bacterium]MBU4019373.1 serine/threonine-protein phosphatase [Gammaproteobacteria bacterium]MBU4081937.1 serine/threonine-protein phosphatase [Gammaproteobacteria bacterium]